MKINYSSAYENMTDEEWVEKLLVEPPIQAIHHYFFKVKCNPFLQYVATTILKTGDAESIMGEFYEFISNNNWYVLRNYRKVNSSSLSTYLSLCTVRYFLKVKSKEDNLMTVSLEKCDAESASFIAEESKAEVYSSLWKAFNRLNEHDRLILYRLVVEGRSTISVAHEVWHNVRSKEKNWRELPTKRVQSTISMMKQRALYRLIDTFRC